MTSNAKQLFQGYLQTASGYDMQRRQHGAVGDYMRMQYELACASSSGRHRQQGTWARGQYNSIQCRRCSCPSTEQQHALLCTTMLGDAGRCWLVAVLWGGAPHLSDTLQLGCGSFQIII
jgi:hypothetical protein